MSTSVLVRRCLALGLALGLTCEAFAGGFAVPEQSASALGVASASAAKTDEPASGFYNPANVAFQKGLNIYVGLMTILPDFDVTPEGATEPTSFSFSDKQFFIPNLYASYAIVDKEDWTLSAGLATFAHFGAAIQYPDDWAGATIVREIDLQTYVLNPYVSYRRRINEDFSFALGGGVDLVLGAVTLKRAIGFAEPDPNTPGDEMGSVHLGANSFAVGGNAGLTFEFAQTLTLGLNYRSRYTFDFSGNADFSDVPAAFSSLFPDQSGSTTLTLPDVISAQLATHILDRNLFISAGVDVTLWSTYQELALEFSEENPPDTAIPKGYRDSVTFRAGAEYTAAISTGFGLKARLGYSYDSSPVPDATLDPTLPDADRNSVSVGLGFDLPETGVFFDLGYLLVLQSTRRSEAGDCFRFEGEEVCNEFPAVYEGTLHLLGLHVGYHWEPGGSDDGDPAPENPTEID